MSAHKLLAAIVERGHGEHIVALARGAGAPGGTLAPGRGTASSTLLQVLGLGGSERDVVLIVSPVALLSDIFAALCADTLVRRKVRGLAFVADVPCLLRLVPEAQPAMSPADPGEHTMHTHVLISVIVNAGYAGDVMHAARKAGAVGGTLLDARGTAREGDETFFGLPIVPEKECLLILAQREQAMRILDAVQTCACLTQPGMGIAFCTPVEQVVPLGGQAAG